MTPRTTCIDKIHSDVPAPQKWKAHRLSAKALEFLSAYTPQGTRPPHPAELDRFSAPDGWELSPERMDQDSTNGYQNWRSTQSESIGTAWLCPETEIPYDKQHHVEQGFKENNGYGVGWQRSDDGESSPVPQRMLTRWLDETRGARTGEDIRQLLEQSCCLSLPVPSLESLFALSDGRTLPRGSNRAEIRADGASFNQIVDDGPLEYVGYKLIPESEVTNVYTLLEDYYQPRTNQ